MPAVGGVGVVIRSARRRRDWSQETLADRLTHLGLDGVDRFKVARWEREDRIPSPFSREKLAAALGITVRQLERAAVISRAHRRSRSRSQSVGI